MTNYIKTGYKTMTGKEIFISAINKEFLGFIIKLTKTEQKKTFLNHNKAVNVSPYYPFIEQICFKNGIEYNINDIRLDLIHSI